MLPSDPHGVRADMRAGRFRVLRDDVLVDSMPDLASAIDLAGELRTSVGWGGGTWTIYDTAVPFEDDSTAGWTVVP